MEWFFPRGWLNYLDPHLLNSFWPHPFTEDAGHPASGGAIILRMDELCSPIRNHGSFRSAVRDRGIERRKTAGKEEVWAVLQSDIEWVGSVSRALSFAERMLSCRYSSNSCFRRSTGSGSGKASVFVLNTRAWPGNWSARPRSSVLVSVKTIKDGGANLSFFRGEGSKKKSRHDKGPLLQLTLWFDSTNSQLQKTFELRASRNKGAT